jgi:MFS family permease
LSASSEHLEVGLDEAKLAASCRRKAYLHIILPLVFTSILAYIDRVNVGYAALTMNKDLGFGPEVYGMGASMFFGGYVLFEIPGALVAERFSPRMWLARIMITWSITCAAMALIRTAAHFYVVRFLLGAAEASLYPMIYASFIPRWIARTDRARAIGVLLTSLQISGIIGAPLAGWILDLSWLGMRGWQLLFIIEAIPAFVLGLMISRGLVENGPHEAKWLTAEERVYLVESYRREVAALDAQKRYTVLEAVKDRKVLKMCITYYLWMTGYWGFNFWMPQVLKSVSGWSNMALGWLTVVPMGLSLIVMVCISNSSSRTGEKRWHGAVGLFVGAIGLGAGAFVKDPWIGYAFVCVAAIGVYAPFGVWWSYPTTFLAGPAAAAAMALMNSVGSVGGFVGPFAIGWLKGLTGTFALAWFGLAGSLIAAAFLMLSLKGRGSSRLVEQR